MVKFFVLQANLIISYHIMAFTDILLTFLILTANIEFKLFDEPDKTVKRTESGSSLLIKCLSSFVKTIQKRLSQIVICRTHSTLSKECDLGAL